MTFNSTERVPCGNTEVSTTRSAPATAPTRLDAPVAESLAEVRQKLEIPYGATYGQAWVLKMAATVGEDLRKIAGLYPNF